MYWSKDDVDNLFSPELLRSLDLSRNQRNSLDELRHRDWGYRQNGSYQTDLNPLLNIGRLSNGSGNDNLETFLALLAIGVLIDQAQDTDRYYDYDYDYDYGVRIDDFLYLFFRILDMNQRRIFTVYFDHWYDDRYYYRTDYSRDHDSYRKELYREMEDRLRLSERQRREMEWTLSDLYSRQWDLERHYRELEKEYLHMSWNRSSSWNVDEHRRELLKIRRDSLATQMETRERFHSILDDQQRERFDAIQRNNDFRPLPQNSPKHLAVQEKPEPPVVKKKPAHPDDQKKPEPPVFKKPPQDDH